MQEQRLKKTTPRTSSTLDRRSGRSRYIAATVATGLAASLGFAAVMLVDVDELRARAAASESLRTIIEHTKLNFAPRQEAANAEAASDVENASLYADDTHWFRQQQLSPAAP